MNNYQTRRNEMNREVSANKRAAGQYASRPGTKINAEWLRQMASFPEDTRTLTGRLAGDPLPGRSALDRRQT
jgi:hypothetical protein